MNILKRYGGWDINGQNKKSFVRKTIVLYMIVSLIVSFYLSALIMRMAATIQDDIWWKYVDQEKYFEMAEGEGRKYLTDVPRPNSYEMKKFDYHVSEICDFLQTFYSTYRVCGRQYHSSVSFL